MGKKVYKKTMREDEYLGTPGCGTKETAGNFLAAKFNLVDAQIVSVEKTETICGRYDYVIKYTKGA